MTAAVVDVSLAVVRRVRHAVLDAPLVARRHRLAAILSRLAPLGLQHRLVDEEGPFAKSWHLLLEGKRIHFQIKTAGALHRLVVGNRGDLDRDQVFNVPGCFKLLVVELGDLLVLIE